jgi:hypothetical protein
MKFKVPHYKVLNNMIEVDFVQFETYSIQTKGEVESNNFLLSLWHQLDLEYGNSDGKCPWAYFPNRYKLKKNLMSFFGIVDTSIGHFYVSTTYKRKGDIDSIHFFSFNSTIDYKSKLKIIINKAFKNINNLNEYTVSADLDCIFTDLCIDEYKDDKFEFQAKNGKSSIRFLTKAIDNYEATQLAEKKLRTLTAFLAIETNVHFDYENVEIKQQSIKINKKAPIKFQDEVLLEFTNQNGKDYIDEYPISNSRLLLTKQGLEFIRKYIFPEREFCNSKQVHNFLQACMHFHKGLAYESETIVPASFVSDEHLYAFSPIGIFNKQYVINNSITLYLSSLEVLSFYGATQSTCAKCNQVQYKISQRVADFVIEYLHKDLGKAFKRLYNIRSKFLHAAECSSSNLNTSIKPMIDSETASGLKDYGFITINVDGKSFGVYTNNVREWTSYCFRRYYSQKILTN